MQVRAATRSAFGWYIAPGGRTSALDSLGDLMANMITPLHQQVPRAWQCLASSSLEPHGTR